MRDFIQNNPPHPGDILLEFYLKPLKLSVTEVAQKLFISRSCLSDVINGKAGISPGMALKLSRALNNTPYFWMNMQKSYDLWEASRRPKFR